MADLSHQFGTDLTAGPNGDLGLAQGTLLGQQRVLRRLLTNQTDYLWQLAYGASLPAAIGTPANPAQLRGAIRAQIFQEAAVARSPEPVIDLVPGADPTSLYVSIRYVDAANGETQLLTFTVNG